MNVHENARMDDLPDVEELSCRSNDGQTRTATIRPSLRVSDENPCALLTVRDVALMLKMPISWVYERTRMRSANRIPGIRLGKYWRFRRADVLAWVERQAMGSRADD